ncbi:MAG: histidine phosphatase family protein [Clostridia bacterium]|nr:histidine phosphatase family protein [Deltaproteobacteria bacterium]
MDILLIRHGATEWSELGKHTGRTDIALTALGEAQARALGSELGDYTIVATLVSPLQRARRTAELAGLAGLSATYTVVPELAEVDYGADEGLTTNEIRSKTPNWNFFRDGPHGGERLDDVAVRCRMVLALVEAIGAKHTAAVRKRPVVACVAHGHLLRILTAVFLGETAQWGAHLGLGTASLGLLGYEHGTPALIRWNGETHLRGVR